MTIRKLIISATLGGVGLLLLSGFVHVMVERGAWPPGVGNAIAVILAASGAGLFYTSMQSFALSARDSMDRRERTQIPAR